MFQSAVSGIVFFLIAVFLGPALLMAAFQIMSGQKVRLPSLVKPLGHIVFSIGALAWETGEVVALMVADCLPEKYARFKPLAGPSVKFAIVCALVWIASNLLFTLADR